MRWVFDSLQTCLFDLSALRGLRWSSKYCPRRTYDAHQSSMCAATYFSLTVAEDVPPPLPSVPPPTETPQSTSAPVNAAKKSSMKSPSLADAAALKTSPHYLPLSASIHSTTLAVKLPTCVTVTAACSKTLHVDSPKRVSKQQSVDMRTFRDVGEVSFMIINFSFGVGWINLVGMYVGLKYVLILFSYCRVAQRNVIDKRSLGRTSQNLMLSKSNY